MEKRIDGLILVSSGTDLELTQLLIDEGIPKVLVDREVPGVAADFIEANHAQGAYLATKHLIELGHRQIACVSGPQTVLSSGGRVAGYLRALQEINITPPSEFLVHSDFTSQGGFDAFQALLKLETPPTAIFACNDLMAIGGLCATQQMGLHVPKDVSIVGYDDIALASFSTPPLTTVAQPKYAIGKLTARALVDRIKHPESPLRREMLETNLAIRHSTGPAKSV